MTAPRFDVAAGGAYGEGWIAFTELDALTGFEWTWDGGNEVHVGAYLGDIPVEEQRIDISTPDGPLIARTPDAFAAFLTGRYSTPEAIEALSKPWEAERQRIHRAMRRQLRNLRVRRMLHRLRRR